MCGWFQPSINRITEVLRVKILKLVYFDFSITFIPEPSLIETVTGGVGLGVCGFAATGFVWWVLELVIEV